MHYHCEIVMPPTDNVEGAVASVLAQFRERDEDCECAFWDFFVIGGRFAGNKMLAKYPTKKIDAFYDWLKAERVTVSTVQCGKESLEPTSQIPKVDGKWNEMFPVDDGQPRPCPLFSHSNDQYARDASGALDGDISALADSLAVKCSRVIFAGPSWTGEKTWRGPLKATFMLTEDEWNGVNHMPIKWDGTIGGALEQFRENLEHNADEYRQANEPQDDWLAVTVDYHS